MTRPYISDQPDILLIPQSDPEPFLLNPDHNHSFYTSFSLLQHEKLVSLVLQGFSREEAERLSQPKPIDREAMEERMMKEQERELRWLAKLSPTGKLFDQRMRSRRKNDDEIRVPLVDVKHPDQCKTKDGDED
jgi:hypothetical protein